MKQFHLFVTVLLATLFLISCSKNSITEPTADELSKNIFYEIEYTEGDYVYVFRSDGLSWIDHGDQYELLSGSLIKIQKGSFIRFWFDYELAASSWNFEEYGQGGMISYNINEKMYEFKDVGTYFLEVEVAESDTFRVQIQAFDKM